MTTTEPGIGAYHLLCWVSAYLCPMNLDEVFNEKSTEDLKKLLPGFRQCQTYQDRLNFWDQNNLHLQLAYPTNTGRTNSKDYQNALRLSFSCESREEQDRLDFLTLEPFNQNEAVQLFEWGIDRRKQMYSRLLDYYQQKYREWGKSNSTTPEPFDSIGPDGKPLFGEQLMYAEERFEIISKNRFHQKFRESIYPQTIPYSTLRYEAKVGDFKSRINKSLDKKELLREEWERVNKNGFGIKDLTWSHDHNLMNGINVHFFNRLLLGLRNGEDLTTLLQHYGHDRFGTWVDVDTYIFAETWIKYRAFVRDFEPNNHLNIDSPAQAPHKIRPKKEESALRQSTKKKAEEVAAAFYYHKNRGIQDYATVVNIISIQDADNIGIDTTDDKSAKRQIRRFLKMEGITSPRKKRTK